jgi:hypothetical protein
MYQKESYGFSIPYQDGWSYKDNESDEGLEINFIPDSDNVNVVIDISS